MILAYFLQYMQDKKPHFFMFLTLSIFCNLLHLNGGLFAAIGVNL